MKLLYKLLAEAFAKRAMELRMSTKPRELGHAKDGTLVEGYSPEQAHRLKNAKLCEELAKDFSNPKR
jgi:hypothetical protein